MWNLKTNSAALAVALSGIVALGQDITVNPSTTYQTIDGFGFSEAFGFGSSIASASSSIQTQVTNYLFSTTAGAGLTILRNRIAAGSGSIEPNAPSGPNAQPTYTWDGNDSGQVWYSPSPRKFLSVSLDRFEFTGLVVQTSPRKWSKIHLR
jgi:O-glycosyl hydrolase